MFGLVKLIAKPLLKIVTKAPLLLAYGLRKTLMSTGVTVLLSTLVTPLLSGVLQIGKSISTPVTSLKTKFRTARLNNDLSKVRDRLRQLDPIKDQAEVYALNKEIDAIQADIKEEQLGLKDSKRTNVGIQNILGKVLGAIYVLPSLFRAIFSGSNSQESSSDELEQELSELDTSAQINESNQPVTEPTEAQKRIKESNEKKEDIGAAIGGVVGLAAGSLLGGVGSIGGSILGAGAGKYISRLFFTKDPAAAVVDSEEDVNKLPSSSAEVSSIQKDRVSLKVNSEQGVDLASYIPFYENINNYITRKNQEESDSPQTEGAPPPPIIEFKPSPLDINPIKLEIDNFINNKLDDVNQRISSSEAANRSQETQSQRESDLLHKLKKQEDEYNEYKNKNKTSEEKIIVITQPTQTIIVKDSDNIINRYQDGV